jgi:pyroglutamyl-peptidase
MMRDLEFRAGRIATPSPRMLLTGFGPFPTVPVNASAQLAEAAGTILSRTWPQGKILVAALPTDWRNGPAQLERLLRLHRPDIALHFGVARDASGFRLETVAENGVLRQADASGYVPRRRTLNTRGPKTLSSTFPIRAIADRLMQLGLPVELSTDAGRYLCNATLYRSLLIARQMRRSVMTGFVHIPADLAVRGARAEAELTAAPGLHELDWDRAVMGATVIAETCLSQALEGVPLSV